MSTDSYYYRPGRLFDRAEQLERELAEMTACRDAAQARGDELERELAEMVECRDAAVARGDLVAKTLDMRILADAMRQRVALLLPERPVY